MTKIRWLSVESIQALHGVVIDDYGGDASIRDPRRLELAVARPRQHLAYGEKSLVKLAATYAVAIVQGHPFVDGDKRAGFMAAAAFLELNGRVFEAPEVDVAMQTLGLAASEVSETQYAAWLEKSSRPAAPKPKKRRK